jgi:MFS family permease
MPATETRARIDRSWQPSVLVAVLAATLLTPMDVPMLGPVLPEIGTAFEIAPSRVGLLVTLYALPGIVVAPAVGALADRVGRRVVLTACLVVFGLAGSGIAFTGRFTVALGLRVVQGFAAGSLLAALAMTVVGDRYSGRRHDAVMGLTTAALSLGTAVYPLAGGLLSTLGWNVPFLLYALALPVAVLVWVALDDPGPPRGDDTNPSDGTRSSDVEAPGGVGYVREAVRAVPTRRALALYGVVFVTFALVFGGLYTALPFYLSGSFAFRPTTIGLVTSTVLLVSAVVSTLNGRVAAGRSTTRLLTVGFALYATALLGVALAGGVWSLVGALLLFGAGSGLVTPTLFAALSGLAPDRARAGVMSLQTSTVGISQAVGPALFTVLGGAVGYQSTLLGASAGAAVFTAVLALLPLDA